MQLSALVLFLTASTAVVAGFNNYRTLDSLELLPAKESDPWRVGHGGGGHGHGGGIGGHGEGGGNSNHNEKKSIGVGRNSLGDNAIMWMAIGAAGAVVVIL
ncbi:hypothetical protein QBC35DRAFT_453361 [Podospora australis]|uniref:Uncharacterized protein n=1 Tax=Podospora australis TaxID=1536484 RepID=A0AAN6WRU2_9PEZI|nr:hypothetical protein QBC35DRAFT_453361 [Podospora australis]